MLNFFYYHNGFYHHHCCCHHRQRIGPQTHQGVFIECELAWEIRVPSPRSPIQSQPKALEKTRTWQHLGPEGNISRACWPSMNQILWIGTLQRPTELCQLRVATLPHWPSLKLPHPTPLGDSAWSTVSPPLAKVLINSLSASLQFYSLVPTVLYF